VSENLKIRIAITGFQSILQKGLQTLLSKKIKQTHFKTVNTENFEGFTIVIIGDHLPMEKAAILIRRIKKENEEIKIIMVSVEFMSSTIETIFKEQGADYCLNKMDEKIEVKLIALVKKLCAQLEYSVTRKIMK